MWWNWVFVPIMVPSDVNPKYVSIRVTISYHTCKKKCPLQNCGSPTCPSFVHYVLLTSFCCLGTSLTKIFIPVDTVCPLYHWSLFLSSRRYVTSARCHTPKTHPFVPVVDVFRCVNFQLHRCIFSNPFAVPGPMITSDCLTRPQDGVKLTTGGWLWILLWIILTTGHHDSSFQKDNLHVERPDSRDHLNYMWVRLTTCLD